MMGFAALAVSTITCILSPDCTNKSIVRSLQITLRKPVSLGEQAILIEPFSSNKAFFWLQKKWHYSPALGWQLLYWDDSEKYIESLLVETVLTRTDS